MIAAMLQLRSLRKVYGELVALRGLDLHVDKGEILALLGPNGAGKSTAVKCTVGLLPPDGGSVAVAGLDVASDPAAAKRRIGYLPEVARLHEALTPREYLLLKGRLFDMDDDRIVAEAGRLLSGFELQARQDEPMLTFSKGMLQKVSLCGALLTGPELLVLDEPLSGLDVNATLLVKELVREFARRGGAVLYCSHMLDVVENIADRVALLDRGQLLACGTLAELRQGAGAAAETRLDSLFRTLTKGSDPVGAAKAMLG
jgi:ABC-2 type transport system ATP-binding protein